VCTGQSGDITLTCDVFLYPPERGDLVRNSIVARYISAGNRQEAKRAQAIVYCDEDHISTVYQVPTIESWVGTCATYQSTYDISNQQLLLWESESGNTSMYPYNNRTKLATGVLLRW
jgi:hypothetical protein